MCRGDSALDDSLFNFKLVTVTILILPCELIVSASVIAEAAQHISSISPSDRMLLDWKVPATSPRMLESRFRSASNSA